MEDQDLINEFITECKELLEEIETKIIQLEKDPNNDEHLNSIFRNFHTIKGTSGFFDLYDLAYITHAGETFLDFLRQKKLSFHNDHFPLLLNLTDFIRSIITDVATKGHEPHIDFSSFLKKLHLLGIPLPPEHHRLNSTNQSEVHVERFGEILLKQQRVTQAQIDEALSLQKKGDTRVLGDILVSEGSVSQPDVKDALSTQKSIKTANKILYDPSIRINVDTLDKLMNLAGELVIVRNQFFEHLPSLRSLHLDEMTQKLNIITSEFQDVILTSRMQPISIVWNKFHRLVKALAKTCNKSVNLILEGEKTELDKAIIEAIKDPLTHIIRNAIDHGIESSKERILRGKSKFGTITLSAQHEGGTVSISIQDDGNGVNLESIKNKALTNNLITQNELKELSEQDILMLIFEPGFSTANHVSSVSGRGVGMDVVKTNLEKIGALLDIQNIPGKGFKIEFKIPLTFAIIPALLTQCNTEKFAIPQMNLVEIIQPPKRKTLAIDYVHDAPIFRLRGKLLPLVFLDKLLSIDDRGSNTKQIANNTIIVVRSELREFGIVVDDALESSDIVVKTLDDHLLDIPEYSGATIVRNGEICLILDVLGIARSSNIASISSTIGTINTSISQGDYDQMVLYCKSKDDGRIAIPIHYIETVTEVSSTHIERSGGLDMIQYNEDAVPLVYISQALPERRKITRSKSIPSPKRIQIAIHPLVGNSKFSAVGLVVESIIDIIDSSSSDQQKASRPGVSHTSILQNRITEFIDVPSIIRDTLS